MASDNVRFSSWTRSGIYDLVSSPTPVDGRLAAAVTLSLTDAGEPGHAPATGASPFHLISARDISGIDPGRILRSAPAPDSYNAETTKMVHVDFADPALPWQYSPATASGAKLKPWIVLLVLRRDDVTVDKVAGVVRVPPTALIDIDLGTSHKWAHVQDEGTGGNAISRLVCPHVSSGAAAGDMLRSGITYVAAIVKAFNDSGGPAWDVTNLPDVESLPLQMMHSWTFITGEAGDFETLAEAIRPRKADGLGRAPLHYQRGATSTDVHIRGAITNLSADDQTERVNAALAASDVEALGNHVAQLTDTLGRNVIGTPTYGDVWLNEPRATTWGAALNADPRLRGSAALGVRMGQEAQDDVVAAVVEQLGSLPLAAHLVATLAGGLHHAGSLWERRMPADPTRQVDVLSPVMRRLRATGGTAMGAITGPDSPLDPSVFSTAARRMLRPRTARTRRTAAPVTRRDAIGAANRCHDDQPQATSGHPTINAVVDGLGLPTPGKMAELEPIPSEISELMTELVGLTVDFDNARFVEGVARLQETIEVIFGQLLGNPGYLDAYYGAVLSWEVLVAAVRQWTRPGDQGEGLGDEIISLLPEPRPSRCRAPDLDGVCGVITEALDPRSEDAPARKRIRDRINGIEISDLRPLEYPAGVDYATWTLLRDHDREWLLPGVGTLEKDSVVAMQTNPAFIDAFLVGLNTQLISEMRWRNIPIDRSTTPLLTFWRHVDYQTGRRVADIQEVRGWPATSVIGDRSHQVTHPGDETGNNDLVLVFRTDLFRRYPKTLIYLAKTPDDPALIDAKLQQAPTLTYDPAAPDAGAARAAREFIGPNFTGTINRDIVFFSFDIDPQTLDQYWLVLDEPPTELRFRKPPPEAGVASSSATFATKSLDRPTRVAFDGYHLKSMGLSDERPTTP